MPARERNGTFLASRDGVLRIIRTKDYTITHMSDELTYRDAPWFAFDTYFEDHHPGMQPLNFGLISLLVWRPFSDRDIKVMQAQSVRFLEGTGGKLHVIGSKLVDDLDLRASFGELYQKRLRHAEDVMKEALSRYQLKPGDKVPADRWDRIRRECVSWGAPKIMGFTKQTIKEVINEDVVFSGQVMSLVAAARLAGFSGEVSYTTEPGATIAMLQKVLNDSGKDWRYAEYEDDPEVTP